MWVKPRFRLQRTTSGAARLRFATARAALWGLVLAAYGLAIQAAGAGAAWGSDHDDTPELKTIPRHDARITDFFAFTRGDRLVLVLCTDPTIPATATDYQYARDLTLRFHVDNDSDVTFGDPAADATYGGTIVRPERVHAEVVFEVTFDKGRGAELRLEGLPESARRDIQMFAGLRDDPFIRGPRQGRNVAAVVLEMPLQLVLGPRPVLVLWSTSKVPEMHGPQCELGGRSLRSQFAENLGLNTLPPWKHFEVLGVPPDVVIFDTSRPAVFPNGRELADDVVDMVGDRRVLDTDAPFPSTNDVPFLEQFPYLAPPHRR